MIWTFWWQLNSPESLSVECGANISEIFVFCIWNIWNIWNVWNIWYIWNTYLKKEVKTESPRASQWSVVQMQAVSRYSRNQRFVIFRSRNISHMKKNLSRYSRNVRFVIFRSRNICHWLQIKKFKDSWDNKINLDAVL